MTSRKTYNQYCTVSRALDYVGDRWTLLIIRELLGGPARFSDLKDGLPTIAKNLLSDRLKQLEGDGLILKRSNFYYYLTVEGQKVRPVVEQLGLLGAGLKNVEIPIYERSVRSIAMAMQAILTWKKSILNEKRTIIELEVDNETIEVVLGDRASVIVQSSSNPDVRIRTTKRELNNFLEGKETSKKEFIYLSGDKSARSLFLKHI
jgi:DNA-binding HxlR family transcriptional regulator